MAEVLFSALDGCAVMRSRGVYRETTLAERDGLLYARHQTGWVRLYPDGRSSNGAAWVQIICGVDWEYVPHEGSCRVTRKLSTA